MIYTRPIESSNWLEAVNLRVRGDQEQFVPSVAMSIAKAYIRPNGVYYDPIGIYAADTGEMVGFYSSMYKPHDLRVVYIGGFLIDFRYQGKGFGKAAMQSYLDTVRNKYPQCEGVYLTVNPENKAAEYFYSRFGFLKTGFIIDGEDAMGLTFEALAVVESEE